MTERQYLQYQIDQLKMTHNDVVHSIAQQRGKDGSDCLKQVYHSLPNEQMAELERDAIQLDKM